MAIFLAFIPGIFGFLGLGHFYSRKFRLGFVYLSIGLLTYLVIFLFFVIFLSFDILFNYYISLIVIYIGYLILLIWQTYDVKYKVTKFNFEHMTYHLSNNSNKISIEVEFPKITYHNIGLSLIEIIARNRIAALYATISMYSMPAITALALFLMVASTIILIQNETAREAVREFGIESNVIDPSNPLIPWESGISMGAISFFSSIAVSQFGRAIIAKLYNIKIQSVGLTTIFGIIPTNPFLELNKDDILKLPLKIKSILFSVDPLSNILLALLSFGFLYLLVISLSPISNEFADEPGITVLNVEENSLAKSIGLEKNSIITFINNEPIEDGDELRNILSDNLGTTVQIKWMTEDNKEQIQSVNLPTSVPENQGILV